MVAAVVAAAAATTVTINRARTTLAAWPRPLDADRCQGRARARSAAAVAARNARGCPYERESASFAGGPRPRCREGHDGQPVIATTSRPAARDTCC